MSRGLAAGIRIAALLVLLLLMLQDNITPWWWWAALAVVAVWSALDFFDGKETDDD